MAMKVWGSLNILLANFRAQRLPQIQLEKAKLNTESRPSPSCHTFSIIIITIIKCTYRVLKSIYIYANVLNDFVLKNFRLQQEKLKMKMSFIC